MSGLTRDVALAASVARAAEGDRIAFARLVDTYHADMMRVAVVVAGGDLDVAADAVQSAWTIAWRKLGSLRDPSRLKSWLLTVAAQETRQIAPRQPRHPLVDLPRRLRPASSDLLVRRRTGPGTRLARLA
jgi:RNA polymerase sigma-70 factor (ECF subfamily)